MFARGVQPFLAGGVSIALQKSATAIRPLYCGDPIRRLVAKCFCFGGKTQISNTFKGKNYGVGCRGGVEVVAHSLRDTLLQHKDSDMALLKIDFKNAFNLIDRNVFVKASSEMFPGLERWTRWCYSESPLLIYDHSRVFLSASGVQQGDPLGPLYFCCGLQSLVDRIADLGPVYQKWYMDDGGIVGPVDLLLKVWEILKVDGPSLGLHLNPAKCEWSWLNGECTLPCPLDLVELVPTSRIQMLGVPLGSDEFVAQFVEGKLLKTTAHVMSKLMEFDDAQAAMYLLRISYGIVRANHFMRTTPLPQWSQQLFCSTIVYGSLSATFLAPLCLTILILRLVRRRRLVVLVFGGLSITLLALSPQAGTSLLSQLARCGPALRFVVLSVLLSTGLQLMSIGLRSMVSWHVLADVMLNGFAGSMSIMPMLGLLLSRPLSMARTPL
jgi:hypothetical protein